MCEENGTSPQWYSGNISLLQLFRDRDVDNREGVDDREVFEVEELDDNVFSYEFEMEDDEGIHTDISRKVSECDARQCSPRSTTRSSTQTDSCKHNKNGRKRKSEYRKRREHSSKWDILTLSNGDGIHPVESKRRLTRMYIKNKMERQRQMEDEDYIHDTPYTHHDINTSHI